MLNIRFADAEMISGLERAQTGTDELIFLKWFVSYYVTENKKMRSG
jgi:hypothetical protein